MIVHNFDDRPVIDFKYDRLGFATPARALAALLARTAAPEGFVAAVTGEWGAGKSTFLNFVKSSDNLSQTPEGLFPLEVVSFDPWLVSGHQDLVAAFFKHLADELRTSWDVAKNVAKSSGKVAAEAGKTIVDSGLAKAAGKIALLVDGGLLAQPTSILAKMTLDKAVEALSEEPSLQKAYDSLSNQLRMSGRRFLVIVDEIDRLSPDEIRTMMNMVKSVGRLPNVIYLLSYDRGQVHDALGYKDIARGQAYAEKIVQHELSLPSPLPGGVLKMLDERIAPLLDGTEDDMRWHRYVSSGLNRWVQKPRDAVRLSGAFNFIGQQLKDEVDLQDVLILEGLRLYQPQVFDWIRRNDAFLFGSRGFYLTDADRNEIGQALSNLLDEVDREDTLSLIANLFPQRVQHFPGQQSTSGTSHYRAKIRGYVQAEDAYRTYFAAGLPEGSVPRATLNLLASPGTTIERFDEALGTLDAADPAFSSRVTEIVEAVRFRVEDRAQEMPFEVLDGLGFHFAQIEKANENAEVFKSPFHLLVGTVRACLAGWGQERTSEYLHHLLESQAPLDFKAIVVSEVVRSLGLFPSSRQETPLVTDEAFEKLKVIALAVIEKSSSDGTLAETVDIWRPLKLWAVFDDLGAAKTWTHAKIRADRSVLYKIGRGLVSRTLGKNVIYTLESNPTTEYVDLLPLMDAASSALPDELTMDEHKLFAAILEGGHEFLLESVG